MSTPLKGSVKARIVDVRFALSGKIASVAKYAGDTVTKGTLIACLDRKILQTELDKQLADYEKVRADFEIFAQKNPDPQEPIDKYLKTEKQAQLNASVKDVEIAKAHLDQADLFSPVTGVILDDSGIVPGLYITPASGSVKVIDTSSFYFEMEIPQEDIPAFAKPKEAAIKITGLDREITCPTSLVYSDDKKFFVKVKIADSTGIFLGQNGQVSFKKEK